MKFCTEHWDELRKAIKDKGMDHLVSKDGKQVIDRLKKEIKEEPVIVDPLMGAHNAITSAAIQDGGVYLLGEDENGNQYCPLCEVEKHMGEVAAKDWISGSTDDQLKICKKNNLLSIN